METCKGLFSIITNIYIYIYISKYYLWNNPLICLRFYSLFIIGYTLHNRTSWNYSLKIPRFFYWSILVLDWPGGNDCMYYYFQHCLHFGSHLPQPWVSFSLLFENFVINCIILYSKTIGYANKSLTNCFIKKNESLWNDFKQMMAQHLKMYKLLD